MPVNHVAVAVLVASSFAIVAPSRRALAADERAANEATYARERDRLRRDFSGGPVVAIAGGEVLGGFESVEAAAAAADARRPGATHRFLFRPGAEDALESIAMSPWVDSAGGPSRSEMAGNWLQVGNEGLAAHGLEFTIAEGIDVRYRGKTTTFPRAPYARFTIATPDGKATRDASFVMSTLMGRSMTVTEALAADLGLDRFAVPGGGRLAGAETGSRSAGGEAPAPYRKVRVRLGIRDLGFDVEAIAVVVPGRTVESILRGLLAGTATIEVRPGPPPDAAAARIIDAPAEVKKIVDAAIASLVPSEPPAGWSWPNEVHFIAKDGLRVVTSIGPGLFGVRLPDGSRSKDYRLSPELEAALRPHLAPR